MCACGQSLKMTIYLFPWSEKYISSWSEGAPGSKPRTEGLFLCPATGQWRPNVHLPPPKQGRWIPFGKTNATYNWENAWCTQRHLHTLQNYAHINSHQWASLGFIFHGTSINMCLINHTMSTHYHQSQMGRKVRTGHIWYQITISWFQLISSY